MAEVARRLGKPFMPWQQYVADVALEVDGTGRLVYNEVGLTVPRQSGKSTLILAKAVHRASASQFFGGRQRLVYTAQTRNKAREKWEEDYAADLKASKTWGPKIKTHFGNGNEHIRFANGSRFGIEANTEKAGHGGTLDEAYIDEAFAQTDNRLEQAFRPAMITRPNTQLWWVSTAGWLDGSPYLLDKVTRGRDQADMGIRDGLAYFEWSAPDDSAPDDRDVWRECMPALGYTVTEESIAAELRAMQDDIAGFRRAYLNQWVKKHENVSGVIDNARWVALTDSASQIHGPIVFSLDVTPDRANASIGAAGRRADGLRHVEIVPHDRHGSFRSKDLTWVVPRMVELVREWNPAAVVVNPSGPAGSFQVPLQEAGVDVTLVGTQQMAQACGAFYDYVVGDPPQVRHIGQPEIASAIGAARKRMHGDAWTWNRKDLTDISPLVAVTLALFGHDQQAAKKPKRTGKVW